MIYVLTEFRRRQWYLVAQFLTAEYAFVEAQQYAEMTGNMVRVDRIHASSPNITIDSIDTNLETFCGDFFPIHKPFRLFVDWEKTPFACGSYKSVQTALAALRKLVYTEACIYDSENSTWLVYRKENGRFRRIATRYTGGF